MSSGISRFEKVFSLQLDRVPIDAVGQTLLQRIRELLSSRADVTRAEFLAAIGRPTPSWGSEFFSAQRTTNNLRLVIKIARYFGVPIGYLLNENEPAKDAGAITLLDAWEHMDEKGRKILLNMALMMKDHADGRDTEPPDGSSGGPSRGGGTTVGPKRRR